jgi:hypothetical protein
MRSKTLRTLSVTALVAVVVLLLAQMGAAQNQGGKLIGTWQVQVAQVDCTSGAPLGPAFSSLLTFAKSGTMTEDTSNPAFGRGQRSAGQGMWSSKSNLTYTAKSVALIKYTTPPNAKTHNPGFNAGQQTITQNITYDATSDEWTSKASVEFANPDGSVYRQGCAEASAQRF